MDVTTDQFVEELVRTLPDLEPLYSEHIRDNRGEVLPHVLMGEIASYAIAASKDVAKLDALRLLLTYLGEHINVNADIRELVMASFLECLLGEAEAPERMKPLMNDSLRMAAAEVLG